MSAYAGYQERQSAPLAGPIVAIVLAQILTLTAFMLPVELVIGLMIATAITVAVIVRPSARLYVLIVAVPISNGVCALGFDYDWVRYRDLLPLGAWFATFAALGICIEHAAKIRIHSFRTPVDGPIALIVLWAAVTLIWAPNFPHALLRLYFLIGSVLTFYVITTTIRNEALLKKAVNIFIVFGVIVAVYAVAMLHLADYSDSWSYPLGNGLTFEYVLKADGARASGVSHSNLTSLQLNLSLSFAICAFVWLKGRRDRFRYLYLIAAMVLAFAILETKSKGGIGTMIAMVGILVLIVNRLRHRFFTNCILCVTFLVCAFLFQTSTIEHTPRVLESGEISLESRLGYWKAGHDLNMALSNGWGLGVGGFSELGPAIPHAHSIYFSIFFEYGPIGIILLLILVFSVTIRIVPLLPFQSSFAQMMVVAGVGGASVLAVNGLVDFSYEHMIIWMYLGIVIAAVRLASRDELDEDAVS